MDYTLNDLLNAHFKVYCSKLSSIIKNEAEITVSQIQYEPLKTIYPTWQPTTSCS